MAARSFHEAGAALKSNLLANIIGWFIAYLILLYSLSQRGEPGATGGTHSTH